MRAALRRMEAEAIAPGGMGGSAPSGVRGAGGVVACMTPAAGARDRMARAVGDEDEVSPALLPSEAAALAMAEALHHQRGVRSVFRVTTGPRKGARAGVGMGQLSGASRDRSSPVLAAIAARRGGGAGSPDPDAHVSTAATDAARRAAEGLQRPGLAPPEAGGDASMTNDVGVALGGNVGVGVDATAGGRGLAIPRLPEEADCPASLEAVLRGLLQPQPRHRLPPEEAIRALQGALYGPEDALVGMEEEDEGGDGDGDPGGAAAGQSAWVQSQRLSLSEAEHALPPLPLAALVGEEAAEEVQLQAGEGSAGAGSGGGGHGRREAASGAGTDDPAPVAAAGRPGAGVGREGASTADEAIERAVLKAADELGARHAGGGDAASQVGARVEGLSMGPVGGHEFVDGLTEAVGGGVLQSRGDVERAVVRAGPMAVLRPPSAGTRALYGWGVEGVLGHVRPLVEGEASLWDRHMRRELMGREDAADEVQRCLQSLVQAVRCFGVGGGEEGEDEEDGDGPALMGWVGPRDRRWVPAVGEGGGAGRELPLPEAEGLPDGWRAYRAPSGRVAYEHADGRLQSTRPMDSAGGVGGGGDLPPGWIQVPGPNGEPTYVNVARGLMQAERPTA